jgi:hypothetical protein
MRIRSGELLNRFNLIDEATKLDFMNSFSQIINDFGFAIFVAIIGIVILFIMRKFSKQKKNVREAHSSNLINEIVGETPKGFLDDSIHNTGVIRINESEIK